MQATRHFSRAMLVLAAMTTATLISGTAIGASDAVSPPPETSWEPAADGARILTVERLDDRTRDLTIESPAVGTVKVRLLLPRAFETRTDEAFPVFYLLHGGGGKYTDWTKNTDVETHTAAADVLVAMPEALTAGLDEWLEGGGPEGDGGLPNWERFHVVELPELLERNWRADEARAVGGNSLGGYAALMYASRRPELYQAVGSYSGALGLAVLSGALEGSVGEIVEEDVDEDVEELVELATVLAEGAGWEGLDLGDVLPALTESATYISYGNGEPGPLDEADAEPDLLEGWIGAGNDDYLTMRELDDVPAEVNAYGPGTHSWTYWDRELRASLPAFIQELGGPTDPSGDEG